MKKVFLILSFAAVAFFAGCASNSVPADSAASKKSATVFIVFNSNPTTGYTWKCNIANTAVAEIISDEYVPDSTEEGITGAGGKHKFVLKGKKAGTTTAAFTYARSWETAAPAEKRVYSLTVNPDLSTSFVLVSAEQN